LAISHVPELLLILGGVIAIFIALKGGHKGLGASLSGLGFVIGALLILGGVRIIISEGFSIEVYGTLLVLGAGLFFRVFHKVPGVYCVVNFSFDYVFSD
jgi:hypothetical protein